MADDKSAAVHRLEEVLDTSLDSVDRAEETVLREAQTLGFDEDEQHRIGIAVRECVVNAVVHGNCYNARKKIHLRVERTADRLQIEIADEGDHFDMSKVPDPLSNENLMRDSGRGLLLMQAFMDEFQVRPLQPRGTEVKLVKYLAKAV
ncbi:MAG TPA: ATP-binding protein [Bryobacteraceae bacterium]|nr:ATP-binding protein [Bryobacteraceae bacterium]